MTTTYEIKAEWEDYYRILESIRVSGIVNMFGASPYLALCADVDDNLATEILRNWMHNYNELSEIYGWRN